MISSELDSLELPAQTDAYRLEEREGRRVVVERRREMLDPGARVFIGRMGEDIGAETGEALGKTGLGEVVGDGTLVAIKVNMGGGITGVPSSYSDLVVVEGVIDAVRELGGRPFICEANMRTLTMNRSMLVHRGLYPLMVRKDVRFVNLSELSGIDFFPLGWEKPVHMARPLFHPDVKVVSVPALKHHWECVVTLAQKNMYGAIAERQKSVFHRRGAIDETVAAAARAVSPDLSVLAHRQVGGRLGPHFCVPIDFGYIVASDNVLAADRVGCDIMGVDWKTVRHLQINCGGKEIPYRLVDGSVEIDAHVLGRIARTAPSLREVRFWRAALYPQYFVPHKTQYRHLFRAEPVGTALNWLFFHTRGDPWPTCWYRPYRPG
jgi:uncharacterized protein (DUF362 family)